MIEALKPTRLSEIPAADRAAMDERFRAFKEQRLEGKSRVTVAETQAIREEFMRINNLTE